MRILWHDPRGNDPNGRAFFFPEIDSAESGESIQRLIFDLGYRQHGGSGLGYSRTEVLAMPLGDAEVMMRLLQEARKADADAIRRAGRGA